MVKALNKSYVWVNSVNFSIVLYQLPKEGSKHYKEQKIFKVFFFFK